MTAPPRSVTDLRIAVLAAEPHLAGIRVACRALELGEQGWEGRSEPHPHLALIESSGLHQEADGSGPLAEEKVEHAVELVGWCGGRGIASILWETSPRREIVTPGSLLRSVDHLFVADPGAVAPLGKRVGRLPMQLPLAPQSLPEDVPGFHERKHGVGFAGHWPADFSGRLRRELEGILAAAADHGLVIFRRREGDDEDPPEPLRSFLTPVPSVEAAPGSLRQCRVVVGFEPRNRSRLMVPQVAFDALAGGSGLLIPNHPGIRRLLRDAAMRATTREEADALMQRLVGDEEEWAAASRLGRTVIRHAHTYSHRLATMASAAGFRVVPTVDAAPLT